MNTLFQYQVPDQIKAVVADPEDYTAVPNRGKWYSFAKFIKQGKVDFALGRNTMLFFLRFMGLLTRDYKPAHGTMLIKHLRVADPSLRSSTKVHSLPYYMLQISGEGLWEIKKAIDMIRKKGGCI